MLSPIASWASETTLARSGTTSISDPHSGITSPADQLQPLAASLETLPSSLASLTCVLMPNSEPSHFALAPALTPPFLASTDGPSLPASAVMCTPSLAVWSFTPEIESVSVPAEPRRLTEVGTDGSALAIDASACLVRPLASTFPRTSGMCSVAFEKRWLPTSPAIADASTVAACGTFWRSSATISGTEIVPASTRSRMLAVWSSRYRSTAICTPTGTWPSPSELPGPGVYGVLRPGSMIGASPGARASMRVTAALPALRCSARIAAAGVAAAGARSVSPPSGWRTCPACSFTAPPYRAARGPKGSLLDHEAVPHGVLGHHARLDELEQVARATRLGAGAGEPVAAERLAGDHRAGDRAVDVEVADRHPRLDVLDGVRVAREQAGGERERGAVERVAGGLDVPDPLDGQQRAEDLLVDDRRVGGQVGGQRGDGEPAAVGHLARLRRDAAVLLRLGGVAGHALLRLLLDHRRHVGVELRGLADLEPLDRAGEAVDQRVVDRLVREHPRRGRALLAREHERAGDDRGHDLVEVGIGVDDHRVLAAHLRDHALEVTLALEHLGGRPDDLQPDLVGAGEGDRVHAGVLHQRGADVALARQQRERVRRHARLAQRLDQHRRAARGLLGRLEDHRVAGGQPRGGHAERDRDREVPRGDDRNHAARRVVQLVALARHLEQGGALREVDGSARVVLEEVDRLADVGVRLRPRLRRLADLERGDLEPPLPQPVGGGEQHLGAALGGRVRPRPLLGRQRQRRLDLVRRGGGGLGHDAVGRAGIGGDQLVALAPLVAHPYRHAHRRPRVVLLERAGELRADRR